MLGCPGCGSLITGRHAPGCTRLAHSRRPTLKSSDHQTMTRMQFDTIITVLAAQFFVLCAIAGCLLAAH